MEHAHRLFPVLAYDPDSMAFLQADGALSFAFLCEPLPGIVAGLDARLKALLDRDWPPNTIVQISLWTSPDISGHLAGFTGLRDGQKDALADRLVEGLCNRLTGAVDQASTDAVAGPGGRNLQLIVSVKIPSATMKPSEQDLAAVGSLRESVGCALSACWLQPRAMDAESHIGFMRGLLNWRESPDWQTRPQAHHDESSLIHEQYLDPDTEVRIDGGALWLGGKCPGTLSASRLSRHADFGSAVRLLGEGARGDSSIREPALFTLNLVFPEAGQQAQDAPEAAFPLAPSATRPIDQYRPALTWKRDQCSARQDARRGGARVCRVWFGVALFADSEAGARRALRDASAHLRTLGHQFIADAFIPLESFLNLLPMCADPEQVDLLARYSSHTVSDVLPMLPVFGPWKGTGSPLLSCVSAGGGQLMGIDPWDWACDGARHIVMAGQGGPMLARALALETLTVPEARIVFVSAGGGYLQDGQLWGGEAVAIDSVRPTGGNPFGIAPACDEEAAFQNVLVAAMASPKAELTREQHRSLDRVMRSVRAALGEAMTLADIAGACAADPDPVARRIAGMLAPWTGDGPCGVYLSDASAPGLTNRCTVLDIGALKGNPGLQRVVLLSLLTRIRHAFRGGDAAQRKLLVLDVPLSLLARDDLARPLREFYRTMSAQGAVVATVAGDLGEVLGSATGQAIAQSAPNFYLLAHRNLAKRLEDLRKARPDTLSDEALTWLRSLQGGEVLFSTPNGMGIARTIQDPFRRLLLTTDASAHALIQRVRRERGLDVAEAIQYILDNDLLGRKAA